jgi:hypothetical protein
MSDSLQLHAGEWVEVRSREDILATLDDNGRLEMLPFMPEMFQYCGLRFQVQKRAHKTCDPPSGMQARRMKDAVHLADLRCGGESHGGCQAGCLIFWKERWLRRVEADAPITLRKPVPPSSPTTRAAGAGCTEAQVFAAVYRAGSNPQSDEPLYACQSTDVFVATTPLPWWHLQQYVEDVRSGNVHLGQLVKALVFYIIHEITQAGLGIGSAMRLVYDSLQKLRGGAPYPWRPGEVVKGTRTPSEKLNLQPGDLVRVRDYREILKTLDQDWRNRGMYFDGELVPFCNGTYSVLRRVEKIVDEKTGKMMHFKNDAIILKDVACEARYAKCRHFCSRAIYPYWREIWLERAAPVTSASSAGK